MLYKSNGKFLLTGEYLVLKGATALALPLKKGQSLEVENLDSNDGLIHWDAFYKTTDNGQQTTDIAHSSELKVQSSEFKVQCTEFKSQS